VISKPVDPEPLRHPDGILLDDEVHVWQVDLIAWEKATSSLFELLNLDEQARAERFIFPAPRHQYVISRALLRRALGAYLKIAAGEVRFRTTSNGKPELAASSDLRFNLSHTQGVTVFAIARHRQVGIDVERIRQGTDVMELAERFFSRSEVEWLRSQAASEHFASFFSCWTAKEAYIKAQGAGLSLPLDSFGVLPLPESAKLQLQVYRDPEETRRWSMWRLDLGADLRAALAIEGKNCKVRLGRWPLPTADDSKC
jgi:4'-phosphopantetheinyl transferase